LTVNKRKDTTLTKRQANLIITLLFALIGVQLLFGAVLLRGQERARTEAEAAQVSAQDALQMQKDAPGSPSITVTPEAVTPSVTEDKADIRIFDSVTAPAR
jgi:hypothetical protein